MADDTAVQKSRISFGSPRVVALALLVAGNVPLVISSMSTQDGSRLLAEVTFQKPQNACPKCGAISVSKLHNGELRCAQCGHQFTISEHDEHRLFVVGVADDAADLVAAKNKAIESENEGKKDEDKKSLLVPATNTWKRVSTLEIEPGHSTEIWACVGARPVSKVTITVNRPAHYKANPGVAVLVSELITAKPEAEVKKAN